MSAPERVGVLQIRILRLLRTVDVLSPPAILRILVPDRLSIAQSLLGLARRGLIDYTPSRGRRPGSVSLTAAGQAADLKRTRQQGGHGTGSRQARLLLVLLEAGGSLPRPALCRLGHVTSGNLLRHEVPLIRAGLIVREHPDQHVTHDCLRLTDAGSLQARRLRVTLAQLTSIAAVVTR